MSVDARDGTDEGDSANDDRHSNVVELRPTDPALPRLEPHHVEHLRSSGLSDETIDLAGLYTERHPTKLAKLLDRKSAWGMGHAIVFPFVDPGATTAHAYRIRPDSPRLKKRKNKPPKPIKYDQSARLGVLTYYPPRARLAGAYADATLGLVLVEGEKKALALDELGHVVVGLTGVWNWLDVEHRDKTGEWRLNASIGKHVALAGRACTIVYDSDAATNDQVMAAAKRLGHALLAGGARSVRFTTPPAGGKLKGIDDYYAAHGGEATRVLVEAAPEIDLGDVAGGERIKSHKALAEAPVSDALRLPDGYMIGRDGSLWLRATRDDADDVRIARAPILIMRRLDTMEGPPAPRVELCYPSESGGSWITFIAQRRVIVDARAMVAILGAAGAPVHSGNASRVVEWLDALAGANPSAEQIPTAHVALRAGWHELDGRDLFVVDRALGDDDGAELAARVKLDDGEARLLSAFTPRGALDAHVAALRDAWQDPTAAAVIAAALAAPLLRPMELANFALHMNGDSSTGKTIRLHIAASIYGVPERIVGNWGASASGLEARAALLCDLPAFYDESGVADPAHVELNLYTLINGNGRPRANADMTIRAAPTWRTVIISTGERALITPDAPTGAQARVIQIPTDVFDRSAREVEQLRDRCVAHAGAFGREWIQIMVDLTRDDWRLLHNRYTALVQRLRATARTPVQARLAAHYAALALAESIAAAEHGIGHTSGSTMVELYRSQWSGRSPVTTLVDRGRDMILDWIAAEPEAFAELSVDDKAARTIGRSRAGFRRDGLVYVIPAAMRERCAAAKLVATDVLAALDRKGWIDRGNGPHYARQLRVADVQGGRARVYVFRYDLMSASADADDEVDLSSGSQAQPSAEE